MGQFITARRTLSSFGAVIQNWPPLNMLLHHSTNSPKTETSADMEELRLIKRVRNCHLFFYFFPGPPAKLA